MKIYTRQGDEGETSLRFGRRVGKDTARVEAYGTVDEASAFVGLALAHLAPGSCGARGDALRVRLLRVQRELFDLGADLSIPPRPPDAGAQPGAPAVEPPRVMASYVTGLEADIDEMEAALPDLRQFILPGGTPAAAALHAARAVTRRAERRVVALRAAEPVGDVLLQYLNRLSDFLFVAARTANHAAGAEEIRAEG
jgi:cob(I)alamin adenosyltransferase